AQQSLLVADFDIAPDHKENKFAIEPQIAQIQRSEAGRGLDINCGRFVFCKFGHIFYVVARSARCDEAISALIGDCFALRARNDIHYLIFSRFALNHSIVRRTPSSNGTWARQPKYSCARLTSSPRRGWPLGLSVCHVSLPSKSVNLTIISLRSLMEIS